MSDIEYGPRFKVTEFKSSDQGAEVAGYVSTYGNVDHGGDVVMRGAFDTSLAAATSVRFLWAHDTHEVIGLPIELKSDDKGLFGRFKISQTVRGRDIHTLLKDGAVDSFSIGYIPTDVEYDEAGLRLLKGVDLLECSVVAMPMNAHAMVTAVKSDDETKATWSASYINDLPDSAFAAIESGGKKDGSGKTTPRSLRHYPHHDASGKLDSPHLNAALSRIGDASNYQGGKTHLKNHAKGSKIADLLEFDDDCPFEELFALVGSYFTIAAEAAEALQVRRAGEERKLSTTHIDAINELLSAVEAETKRLEQIASPPPSNDDGQKTRLALASLLDSPRARALLETT